MDLGLKGRTALVTGASRGIGFTVAAQFAEEGADLVLAARSAEGLAAARDRLCQRFPVKIETMALDLGEAAEIDALAAAHPGIDILVNNANAPRGPLTLEETDDERWWRSWRIKAAAAMRLTRAYLPLMRARGGGVMINVIGINGENPRPETVIQSTAGAALIAFTRAVGKESPKSNVRVIGVSPGPVNTEQAIERLRGRAAAELGDAERWPELQADLPFGRAAHPEEVAALIAFLASPRAGYISGAVVTIAGGM